LRLGTVSVDCFANFLQDGESSVDEPMTLDMAKKRISQIKSEFEAFKQFQEEIKYICNLCEHSIGGNSD